MANERGNAFPLEDAVCIAAGVPPRRTFVKYAAALTAAGLSPFPFGQVQADSGPPPETTRLRLTAVPAICLAPQYVAEALLNAEGFTHIEYTKFDMTVSGEAR